MCKVFAIARLPTGSYREIRRRSSRRPGFVRESRFHLFIECLRIGTGVYRFIGCRLEEYLVSRKHNDHKYHDDGHDTDDRTDLLLHGWRSSRDRMPNSTEKGSDTLPFLWRSSLLRGNIGPVKEQPPEPRQGVAHCDRCTST